MHIEMLVLTTTATTNNSFLFSEDENYLTLYVWAWLAISLNLWCLKIFFKEKTRCQDIQFNDQIWAVGKPLFSGKRIHTICYLLFFYFPQEKPQRMWARREPGLRGLPCWMNSPALQPWLPQLSTEAPGYFRSIHSKVCWLTAHRQTISP